MKQQGGYPEELKRQAITAIDQEHRTIEDVALDLGVPTRTIRKWLEMYHSTGTLNAKEAATIRKQRKKIDLLNAKIENLREERDILRTALAHAEHEKK